MVEMDDIPIKVVNDTVEEDEEDAAIDFERMVDDCTLKSLTIPKLKVFVVLIEISTFNRLRYI